MHENGQDCNAKQPHACRLDRRSLLVSTGMAAAGVASWGLLGGWLKPRTQPVFIARNQRYDGPLTATIREGLVAAGFDPAWVRGRRVLLKPNLVEPSHKAPHRTTHPAVVLAAAEAFLGWGAQVMVGEGPGHVRDTEMALIESGLQAALKTARLPFDDFNYGESRAVANRSRRSSLREIYFPTTVLDADLVVSLPKLKTHHWVGMTAAMKNLYGSLPGLVYGWPKNVLHHAGIPETVVDINASLPPTIAIVDAILAMEGDGPIMGTPKPLGLLVIGTNSTAVDATCARIMDLEPGRISYLAMASGRLGPIQESRIVQRGERWQEVVNPFNMIDQPDLQALRANA